MDDSGNGQTRPRKDYFLWISSPTLLLFTAALLWGAFSLYQDRIATISLTERRFLTTEWRLLQELKAQTDRELFQKDQQIADLNRLYLELLQSDASPSRRQEVRNQLDQAEAERKAILSRSISRIADSVSTPEATVNGAAASGSMSSLTELLQSQVEGLQAQLDNRRALIEALDKERTTLISVHERTAQGYADRVKQNMARIQELSATVLQTDQEVRSTLAAVSRKTLEAGPMQPLSIEDLKTQALVRAIVGSPEIRAAYPDLLKSLDHFFEVYGLHERLLGHQEAYASVESILDPLAAEVGTHDGTDQP